MDGTRLRLNRPHHRLIGVASKKRTRIGIEMQLLSVMIARCCDFRIVTRPVMGAALQYLGLAVLVCSVALASQAAPQRLPVDRIKLPPGFEIGVFADNVPDARSLAHGKGQVVFVSTRGAGRVYAVRYGDGGATKVVTIASRLNSPNGIALRD